MDGFERYTHSYWDSNPKDRESISKEHFDRALTGVGWDNWVSEFKKYITNNNIQDALISFENEDFTNVLDFNNFTFPCYTSFRGAKFLSGMSFHGTVFRDGVDFRDIEIQGYASFQIVHFNGYANFENIVFPANCSFNKCQFKEAKFTGTTFFSADFVNCRFELSVTFQDTCFRYGANFSDSNFENIPFFNNAHFKCDVNFSHVVFDCSTVFSESIFDMSVNFSNAKFIGQANLNNLKFPAKVYFSNTEFENYCIFSETKFEGNVHFDRTIFGKAVFFNNAVFSYQAIFKLVNFEEDVDLQNAIFSKVPDFNFSKYSQPPHLTGVKIPFDKTGSMEVVDSFRRLKKMAIESNDYENELRFFGYELRAKTKLETTKFSYKAFINLYFIFSNFGKSFFLPLFWFFIALFAFYQINISLITPNSEQCISDKTYFYEQVQAYTFSSASPLIQLENEQKNVVKNCLFGDQSLTLKHSLWKTIHFIVISFFLFLFGLAIRNNLKIK